MHRLRRGVIAAGTTLCVALALPLALRAGGAGVRLPGTQPADGSGDPAFPPFNDAGVPGTLESPRLCSTCHANYRGTNERMYEYWDTWAGSMMANAARDPLLWAALDIANQDDAALGNVGVGDLCLRCHVPRAWYEGRSHCATAWGESFDGACLQGPPSARDNDFEGITCSVCHRAYDASAPPPGDVVDPLAPRVGNAQLYLSTDERRLLGPLTDADTNGYHAWLASRFHASSAFCGQCHEVTNPVRNRRDAVTGADLGYLMPIERTYSEYLQSRLSDPAAPEHETCQTCHMPQPDLDDDGTPDDAYACEFQPGLRGENTALDGPLRTHVFAGASAWMQSMLRDEYAASLNRVEQFDNAIDQTTRLMTQRAVTAGITAPPSVMAGRALPVVVRVTNLAGHKFPTGYPEGRRAWVQVAAGVDADADGVLSASEAQFTSGAYDAASGVLAKDAQLKLYEAKLGVFDHNGTGTCDDVDARTGGPMFHFVLNDCVISDDRIPPLGFVPGPETAPVGYAYPDNPAMPGTLANYDDTPYSIVVPASATGNVVVEARVLPVHVEGVRRVPARREPLDLRSLRRGMRPHAARHAQQPRGEDARPVDALRPRPADAARDREGERARHAGAPVGVLHARRLRGPRAVRMPRAGGRRPGRGHRVRDLRVRHLAAASRRGLERARGGGAAPGGEEPRGRASRPDVVACMQCNRSPRRLGSDGRRADAADLRRLVRVGELGDARSGTRIVVDARRGPDARRRGLVRPRLVGRRAAVPRRGGALRSTAGSVGLVPLTQRAAAS